MGVGATQSTRLTPAGVDAVRIGKDVIEILTSGMYVSPVTVYREYIQNAADSIDAARSEGIISSRGRGRVSVDLDHATRSAVIRDNGAGVSLRCTLNPSLCRRLAKARIPRKRVPWRGTPVWPRLLPRT